MSLGKSLFAALTGIGMLTCSSAFAAGPETGRLTITNNKPKFAATTKSLGAVDPNSIIEVTLWLKPHNQSNLDATAKELYDPKSPSYRHFLTKADFTKTYAPTAAEAKKVSDFFTSNSLKVVSTGPDNFFVRASGTAAAVSSAFHVTLNNYEVNGKIVRGNLEDPSIAGEAGPLVAAVAGLNTAQLTHPNDTQFTARNPHTAPDSSASAPASPSTSHVASATSSEFPRSSTCILPSKTQKFTTDGGQPTGTFTGNLYSTNNSGCGFTPQQIYEAYNLKPLYAEGYDGTGQTIVIVDWCGSPTIRNDANAFSAQFGLPELTEKNFQIVNTPGPSYCEAADPEINIDVEWAHAIAPGAAITLVVPPSPSFQDINEGTFYAVNYQLGNVLSGSYGAEESQIDGGSLLVESFISESAAVLGISTNYSSGDQGDYTYDTPETYPPSVSTPASSPYATSVGGISLELKANNEIQFQAGWGTNQNTLAYENDVPDPPTDNGFFQFGSGGGPSGFFAKPEYQSKLKGTARLLPDISWLGDPYTGAYIAISEPFTTPELHYQIYGGTSLACPMFSALWAIANQEAGEALGQAAPYLYAMPASTITDILPIHSNTNVTGVIEDAAGKTKYSAADLAQPLEGTTQFVSAIWDYPTDPGYALLLTFGTDSGLAVTKGWDPVTGVGVPNGKAFADYFKQ